MRPTISWLHAYNDPMPLWVRIGIRLKLIKVVGP